MISPVGPMSGQPDIRMTCLAAASDSSNIIVIPFFYFVQVCVIFTNSYCGKKHCANVMIKTVTCRTSPGYWSRLVFLFNFYSVDQKIALLSLTCIAKQWMLIVFSESSVSL